MCVCQKSKGQGSLSVSSEWDEKKMGVKFAPALEGGEFGGSVAYK